MLALFMWSHCAAISILAEMESRREYHSYALQADGIY